MKYGVFDHVDFGAGSLRELYDMRLALIEKYDAAGFYGYHQAEHHGTKLGASPSPAVFLSAAAQRSKTLRLGAMVFCVPLYQPVRLLEEICMLDQMSNGRLDMGVGRGISPYEVAFFGLDPKEGPAVYREYLDLILEGLKGGELNFDGEYYSIKDMPMVLEPVQRPHPPLWVGLGHPDATVWPAQNGINVISNVTGAGMRAVTDRYKAEWAANGGAPADLPLLGLTRHTVISENSKEAWAIARRAYLPWRKHFMTLWDRYNDKPINVTLPPSIDELAEEGKTLIGTPEEVADQAKALIEESGINYLLARFTFGDTTYEEAARSVDLFAKHMMVSP